MYFETLISYFFFINPKNVGISLRGLQLNTTQWKKSSIRKGKFLISKKLFKSSLYFLIVDLLKLSFFDFFFYFTIFFYNSLSIEMS